MDEIVYAIATREQPSWLECVASWHDSASKMYLQYIVFDQDVLPAYQMATDGTTEPILAFLHDDLMIYEKDWDLRVLKEFEDETVGIVGFGGALRHGSPDLYTAPYRLPNLARGCFMSNMRTAEKHGTRFTGARDIAILDGFALFVRRSLFDKIGGWNLAAGYFLYCEWLCCEARRAGYRIRLVGVDCEHLGGRTASMVQVSDDFNAAHRWLYDNYRDVLPAEVK